MIGMSDNLNYTVIKTKIEPDIIKTNNQSCQLIIINYLYF